MEMFFVLFGWLAFTLLVQGQSQSGFINIDCGILEGYEYTDTTTNLLYTSDMEFIDTGRNANISQNFMSNSLSQQLSSVRSFPQGINNCYTIKPDTARGNKYLIRAIFMYGNYDSLRQPPEFSLYLEVNEWDTVQLVNGSDIVVKEIIHIPVTDYIHVCLVNTGSGTPFISALELRPLNNSIYNSESGSSLALHARFDLGSTTNQIIRYGDDVYDRIWFPYSSPAWEPIRAPSNSDIQGNTGFMLPWSVLRTAVRPANGTNTLDFTYTPPDSGERFHLFLHFAEIRELQSNQSRRFNISLNGNYWYGPTRPNYLLPTTVYTINPVAGNPLRFSIYMTGDSTLPPILNAFEIYMVKQFPQSPTNQDDVDAIRTIKSEYGVERNWQGDPCTPRSYSWDGLRCSYNDNVTTIISLNLSSSSLSGNIASSLSALRSLQSLDLSNNSLTGTVPDFLSQMSALSTINLSGNRLTGSVPSALIERRNNGSLTLSIDGNPNLCQNGSCNNNKRNVVVPVVASIVSCLVVLTALAILWCLKRRKQRAMKFVVKPKEDDGTLEYKNRQFAYSEVVSITNNFQKILGRGGFGAVYGGCLKDGTEVAVKMLSLSSTQGSKQFRAEAQLLTKVHHRNLASLIGYCNESQHMGLIYEYMANGNLQEHLSGKNAAVLSWEQRLQIAVDAAQALEYLHNGCKPPIIHRDIKTSNILLNEKMQAKVADFGLSRFMPLEGESQASTTVVGTPGYLDPEYYVSTKLNEKSDVYSFGIVLLELITGQHAIVKAQTNINIVDWVKPMLERGEIGNIIDSRLQGDFDTNSVWKAVETAMACVPPSSIQRLDMSHVLVELKECLEIEIASERNRKANEDFETISGGSIVIDLDSSMVPYARDLSNNSLTGTVPDFLIQMSTLRTIKNLSVNRLTSSVPSALIERRNNGSLTLRSTSSKP